MNRQIFPNLPVKDLPASQRFFRALGFEFNPQFSDETAACLVIAENVSQVMLLREDFFQTCVPHAICDTTRSNEALLCLSCESRAEVNDLVQRAVKAGGRVLGDPQEHGDFMYLRRFQDLDGHIWELMHMSSAAPVPATDA